MRRSVDQYDRATNRLRDGYDHINQAWVKDFVYVDCSHPQPGTMLRDGTTFEGCSCYGRLHAGEQPPAGLRTGMPETLHAA